MPDSSPAAAARPAEANGSLAGVALWLGLGVAALCAATYGGFAGSNSAALTESRPTPQKVSLWPEIVPSSLDVPAASDLLPPTP
jgi:hypothetical protein